MSPFATEHGLLDPFTTRFKSDLEDDPEFHRWRAYCNCTSEYIELVPYPVIRKTECGAWIDPYAYRRLAVGGGMEWSETPSGTATLRFVYDNSASAWAKPTQKEAIHSLAIRTARWASILKRDVTTARKRANLIMQNYPEHVGICAGAIRDLDHI